MNIPNTKETFAKKLVKQGACLLWTGSVNDDGYGQSSLRSKSMLCHRIAWTLWNGTIPEGRQVLHSCDTPACCNVAHLFLGDHSTNMRDMWNKDRHSRPTGAKNNHAKLTLAQVEEIRGKYARREAKQETLAAEYGVRQTSISNIVTGRTW